MSFNTGVSLGRGRRTWGEADGAGASVGSHILDRGETIVLGLSVLHRVQAI